MEKPVQMSMERFVEGQTQDKTQNGLSMRKFCFTSALSGPDENRYPTPTDPHFLKVNEVNEKRSSSDTQLHKLHIALHKL